MKNRSSISTAKLSLRRHLRKPRFRTGISILRKFQSNFTQNQFNGRKKCADWNPNPPRKRQRNMKVHPHDKWNQKGKKLSKNELRVRVKRSLSSTSFQRSVVISKSQVPPGGLDVKLENGIFARFYRPMIDGYECVSPKRLGPPLCPFFHCFSPNRVRNKNEKLTKVQFSQLEKEARG
jgi:hypothetical protein